MKKTASRKQIFRLWILFQILYLAVAIAGCLDNEPKTNESPAFIGNDEDMVLIPAGEFVMGNEDEKTAHIVYLDAYYIDRYPVTNAQYRKFIAATSHSASLHHNDARFNQPDHPVVGLSARDAAAYAKWAQKRLPTEAEWEKAARGGLAGNKYPWGDESPNKTLANFGDNEGGTTSVGKYPPNGFALYDMAGNVFNLCSDKYHWDYYKNSPRKNPRAGGGPYQVVRGGSWRSIGYYLRCSSRYDIYDLTRSYVDVGFRCAKTASGG